MIAIFCLSTLAGRNDYHQWRWLCLRDFVYVTDVAQANLQALTQPINDRYQAFNIGTGQGTTINELGRVRSEIMRQRNVLRQLKGEIP
ncbi:MAG: NAD-dependent epimerase/dehydratase family protein [Planctomycetaceae bacterium]